jgi:hypothetical protein
MHRTSYDQSWPANAVRHTHGVGPLCAVGLGLSQGTTGLNGLVAADRLDTDAVPAIQNGEPR